MHCARLFQIVTDPEANVFSKLEKDLYKEMRKALIEAILHTDITKHFEMVKDLNILYQMHSDDFEGMRVEPAVDKASAIHAILAEQKYTQLMLNTFLHGADVGNPMKPWELCETLGHLCLDEFFAQGDKEKELGIPVQMLNDRDKVSRPNSQVGFIEFVIAPMAEGMVHLFPALDDLADNMGYNGQRWAEIWVEQTKPDEEASAKVRARMAKMAGKMSAVMRPQAVLDQFISSSGI
jgi:hypothetical protein